MIKVLLLFLGLVLSCSTNKKENHLEKKNLKYQLQKKLSLGDLNIQEILKLQNMTIIWQLQVLKILPTR